MELWVVVLDVLNGQTFGNARLTPLSGLVRLWSAQVLLIETSGWFSTSLAASEHVFAIQWPAAAVNAKRSTKRSHQAAPAAPRWSRRAIFFFFSNSLPYCTIRCYDPSPSTADAHACLDADGSDRRCVRPPAPSTADSVQRRAEWSDWGDCGLLTEVLVRPQDVCSHWLWDRGLASLGGCEVDLSVQDAALTFHNLAPIRLPAYCAFQKVSP
ncbi:hypothetical protein EYF80_036866 [Liparis tanakae]|uniref:Uncharacterized protein n=1 Tax=Liparis tanakae TaxID=230148 RepID=A0A4Z2GH94_9TELE|nr:hypothetical protein EYF80_036866 [Liparis tanakae]